MALPIANQLELNSADGQIILTLVDDDRGVLYLAVTDQDGLSRLVRVDKEGLVRDETIELGHVELRSAVVAAGGAAAYLGLTGDPGTILQVDLEEFSIVDELTLLPGQMLHQAALSGASGESVYFALSGSPGRILRIDTISFQADGVLELAEGESGLSNAVLAPDGRYSYWAANHTDPFLGRRTSIVKVDLHEFQRVDGLVLPLLRQWLTRLFMDPDGDAIWALARMSNSYLIRVDLHDFELDGELELPEEVAWVNAAVMEASGKRAVFAGGAEPPTVVRVDLRDMQLMDSVLLEDHDLAVLFGGLASATESSVYFRSTNHPARLVELDIRKPFLRFSPAVLDFGYPLVGWAAAPESTRLENTGGAPAESLQFQDESPAVMLAEHDCPTLLEPGEGCDLTLLFVPASPGPNSEPLHALSTTAAEAQLELKAYGQESVAMAVTDYGLGPDWFYGGDFLELGKPLILPLDSSVRFWVNDAVSTAVSAFDGESLEWMHGFSGLWDARAVNSAVSYDGSAVYLAIEEDEGALLKTSATEHLQLHPTGNPDPVRVVQTSLSEDRLWFATGSQLARLFEVDGEDFTIVDELQVSVDGGVDAAVLDEGGNRILLALDSNPVRIVEVDLADFSIVGELALPQLEGRLKTGLIDPVAGLAHFASNAVPAEFVTVALETLSLADLMELDPVAGTVVDGTIDAAGRRAYLVGDGPDGVTLTRIDLDKLLADALVRLGPNFHSPGGVAVTQEGDHALIPAKLPNDRVVVVRMRQNAAQLRFEPAVVDFGEVLPGSQSSAEVWLHNDGDRTASLLNLYLPAADFTLLSSDCSEALPAGESCRIEISLHPVHGGERSGALHAHSSDGPPALLTVLAIVKMPVFKDRFEIQPEL